MPNLLDKTPIGRNVQTGDKIYIVKGGTTDSYADIDEVLREEKIQGTVVTASVSSTYAIDWNAGSVFILTMTADTTFSDTNLPTGANSKVISIELTGSFTPTFPSYYEAKPNNDSYNGAVRNEITVNCKVGTTSSENVTYSLENLAT